MIRKLVFQIHLYVGLVVGLLLVSAGLTGSVLVWKNEIDALLHPELLRVEPAQSRISLQQVVETAARAFPDRPAAFIQMARSPWESVEVNTAGADPLQVYVDPYRGTVLGARRPTETFANALFYWHTSLLSGEMGERVMGTAALLLLVLVLSGLVVWWPGMRRWADGLRVKWSANWKRVNFDVHRAGGFWSVPFLTVVAVTGSSLVFHDSYMAGLNWATRSPSRPASPMVSPRPGEARLPLDHLVERANRALPGGEVTYVTLSQATTAPVVVRKKLPAELHPNGRNFIYLHPQTGEVLVVENALTAPSGARAYNILYPIHIGRWGGVASRVLYSLLGLVPLLLFVSGLLMWRNRTRGKRRKAIGAGTERRSRRSVPAA
jgi:uncharacterized iron-regulated membrane protein